MKKYLITCIDGEETITYTERAISQFHANIKARIHANTLNTGPETNFKGSAKLIDSPKTLTK